MDGSFPLPSEAAIDLSLENKTAIVCGASQGIGQAAAIALASQGCRIFAVARSKERLERVIGELPGSGHRAVALDLSQLAQIKPAIADILKHGPVHVLLNNTGGPPAGPLVDASPEQLIGAFAAHVVAAHTLSQLVIPGMKEARYGRILNVLSTSVKIPLPNLGVSNTIRAAMANWAKTMAMELGPFGITVNNVLPGFIETQRLESLIKGSAAKLHSPEDKVAEQWREGVPAKRFGEPREMGEAIAFLASPAAGYINGINLPVDGGRTGSL